MDARPPFLPYGRQSIDEDDIAAVVAVLRGDWLTGGPAVGAFEQEFARITASRHAVVCANGTAALHLAALAARLGPGMTAVVPSLTFLATANCLRYVGAEVVFADVDADTGLLTAAKLEEALARATKAGLPPVKAVLPVHLTGQTCDLAGIADLARRHDLLVVEDACHATGTVGTGPGHEDEPVGACRHSAMAVFSFHPVKTVTSGEGGMVTTRDDALAARLRLMRSHGMTRDPAAFSQDEEAFAPDGSVNPWYYEMAEPGFNYRLPDINCALGLSQLGKLGVFAAARRRLAARYDTLLAPLAPLLRPIPRMPWCRPAWHLYGVLVDFAAAGLHRAEVMRKLQAMGVGTQVHYLPVHRQPYYRDRCGVLDLPGADAYYARCLSLPLFPAMTEEDQDRVVGSLAAVLREGA